MNSSEQQMKQDLSELLKAMSSFTSAETAEVGEFIIAGEYGVALETLCGIVKEEKKPVPVELRPKVRMLAKRMKIDPMWWKEVAGES
jgi:hypothetical protein